MRTCWMRSGTRRARTLFDLDCGSGLGRRVLPIDCFGGKDADVAEVTFSSCSLIAIPEIVFEFPGLNTLSFPDNDIRTVSPRVAELKYLRQLAFEGNALTSIPEFVCHLEYLQELELWGNNLREVPGGLRGKELTSLTLSDNPIREVPEWIGQMSTLENLHLSSLFDGSVPEALRDG